MKAPGERRGLRPPLPTFNTQPTSGEPQWSNGIISYISSKIVLCASDER
jgi:hypothetical protein